MLGDHSGVVGEMRLLKLHSAKLRLPFELLDVTLDCPSEYERATVLGRRETPAEVTGKKSWRETNEFRSGQGGVHFFRP